MGSGAVPRQGPPCPLPCRVGQMQPLEQSPAHRRTAPSAQIKGWGGSLREPQGSQWVALDATLHRRCRVTAYLGACLGGGQFYARACGAAAHWRQSVKSMSGIATETVGMRTASQPHPYPRGPERASGILWPHSLVIHLAGAEKGTPAFRWGTWERVEAPEGVGYSLPSACLRSPP